MAFGILALLLTHCVWAWELTFLTELLPLENGVMVLTSQGCWEDYVTVGIPSVVLGTVAIYKWEHNAISLQWRSMEHWGIISRCPPARGRPRSSLSSLLCCCIK